MREVARLHRDQGSRLGRVVYRDEASGKLEEGDEQPWQDALAEARAVAGPGAQVAVWVFGRSTWYGSGYRKLTGYPVQLPRDPEVRKRTQERVPS